MQLLPIEAKKAVKSNDKETSKSQNPEPKKEETKKEEHKKDTTGSEEVKPKAPKKKKKKVVLPFNVDAAIFVPTIAAPPASDGPENEKPTT